MLTIILVAQLLISLLPDNVMSSKAFTVLHD